jgi:Glyoxalase/Bleomycin resistance protein/Dioxygenase superfamily
MNRSEIKKRHRTTTRRHPWRSIGTPSAWRSATSEYGGVHWITVGPVDQPKTSIVLYPPGTTPGITDDKRRMIAEMMAKGTHASINLATTDLDGTFERLQAGDAEVVQEPIEQPYGVRDCSFRDPAGNLIRIQELR